MARIKTRGIRGSSGIEYVIAVIFVAMTAIIGYRAFGKQVRCRMGIATTALDLDGKEVNACDDGSLLAQNGPSGNSGAGGDSGGPSAPTVNCNACKTKSGCFVAGTPVMTEGGPRPIETITTGTVVLTRDQDGGEPEWRPVARTVTHRVHALVKLTLADAGGATDTLVATPDHPMQSLERGWVKAAELVPGRDHLLDADGEQLDLVDGESQAADVLVYNFEVAGTHTYFVGRLATWVHNADANCLTPGLGDDSVPTIAGGGGSSSAGDPFSKSYWEDQLKAQDAQNKTKIFSSTKGDKYWKDNKSDAAPRNLNDVVQLGPGIKKDLANAAASDPTQLKIYRGMSNDESQKILAWSTSPDRQATDSLVASGGKSSDGTQLEPSQISSQIRNSDGILPIGAHLGDLTQATKYGGDSMVEITLKPGAGQLLFDPKYTVLGDTGQSTAVINEVYKGNHPSSASGNGEGSSSGGKKPKKPGNKPKPGKGQANGGFQTTKGGEGAKAGWIGVKSEREGYFSISLGTPRDSPSNLLFQQYIESIRIVPKNEYAP